MTIRYYLIETESGSEYELEQHEHTFGRQEWFIQKMTPGGGRVSGEKLKVVMFVRSPAAVKEFRKDYNKDKYRIDQTIGGHVYINETFPGYLQKYKLNFFPEPGLYICFEGGGNTLRIKKKRELKKVA
ncbi:MAG: hypothetical protein KKE20_01070 [Nanoarchaeota archaeon]|nr:hypothetical protein [Nanoarchaeota archaeon]